MALKKQEQRWPSWPRMGVVGIDSKRKHRIAEQRLPMHNGALVEAPMACLKAS